MQAGLATVSLSACSRLTSVAGSVSSWTANCSKTAAKSWWSTAQSIAASGPMLPSCWPPTWCHAPPTAPILRPRPARGGKSGGNSLPVTVVRCAVVKCSMIVLRFVVIEGAASRSRGESARIDARAGAAAEPANARKASRAPEFINIILPLNNILPKRSRSGQRAARSHTPESCDCACAKASSRGDIGAIFRTRSI